MLTSPRYFLRASRARIAEAQVRWVRAGRVSEARGLRIAGAPWRYYLHLPFSFLPAGLHRFLTDGAYFKRRLWFMFVRPIKLYFNTAEREKWLREMIDQGVQNRILGEPEAERIRGQLKEPFIQKYLKSLAVHVATLFISETVFLTIAVVYVLAHPDLSWQQATLRAGLIIGALNLLPISPGSLVRGFYVVGLMIKDRNFRDYNIAFGVSFLKIIGYLAFPIQMAYRYPDLARFMAGHWATEAVHKVPVFGEKGAWLEHFAFDAFYNLPLTIQRRVRLRAEKRKGLAPRYLQAPAWALAGTALLAGIDYAWYTAHGSPPVLKNVWWIVPLVPAIIASLVSSGAGGMAFGRRLLLGTASGATAGLLYALVNTGLPALLGAGPDPAGLAARCFGYFSLAAVTASLGALAAEIRRL
jgi:hypothetical protein